MSPVVRKIIVLILVAVFLVACGELNTNKLQEEAVDPTPNTEPNPTKQTAENSSKEEAHSEAASKSETPVEHSSKPEASDVTEKPLNTWIKTYGGSQTDVVNDLLAAKDGGFYILGGTNIDWESWVGAEIYLIRTDQNGEVVWEKFYGGAPFQTGQAMTFTHDGNLMLASSIARDENTRMDIYLLKVDPDGKELESLIIGGPMDEHVNTIQRTKDGGYILFGNIVDPNDFVTDPGIAGYGGFENRSSILVIKLDQDGNQVWKTVIDNGKNVMNIGGGATHDGGYYVLSTIINFPQLDDDMSLIKLDQNGEEVWSRIWDEARINARDYQITPEGNLLIGSLYSESGDPRSGDGDLMLLEVDQDGTEIWKRIFGVPDEVDILSGVIGTKDGGYLVVVDRTADLYSSASELTLIKLNEQGEIVWEKILDKKPHYMVRDLIQLEDGCVIATSFQKYAQDTFDIMLVKTDMEGAMSH